MTDPLSVSASIAGLVGLTDILVGHLVKYLRGVKDAKREVSTLLRELSSLAGILRALELLAKELGGDEGPAGFQTHHITSCTTLLLRLRALLDSNNANSSSRRLVSLKRTLHWPISKPESENLLKELERHKSALSLALEADSFTALLKACSRQESQLADGFEKIEAGIGQLNRRFDVSNKILYDENRRRTLDYFGTVDPSKYYRACLEIIHPGTVLYFTDGDEFRRWRDTPSAKLWITGIPGAGKTILVARIIQTLQNNLQPDESIVYFFCDYRDPATQSLTNILGSLAKQFAGQDGDSFAILQDFYEQRGREMGQVVAPSVGQLSELVLRLSQGLQSATILIDGLDECTGDQVYMLEILISLVRPGENNIKILIASRDEHQIRSQIDEFAKISIVAQSSDLKLFVLAEMEKRSRMRQLRIKSPQLKEEIMTRLIDKAQGMWTWVRCQLDYICELNSDKERRQALDFLPPTLNATYKRILKRVNERGKSVQNLVRKSLLWLACADTSALPYGSACRKALAEGLSVDLDTERLGEENLIDPEAISTHCGSLVRLSKSGFGLELAHVTVKEFLFSIDPQDSAYAQYRLDQKAAEKEIAETCLRYLNLANFSVPYTQGNEDNDFKEIIYKYPFFHYASTKWLYHAQSFLRDDDLQMLLRQLFCPAKSDTFMNWILFFTGSLLSGPCEDHGHSYGYSSSFLAKLVSEASVLHWACFLALPEITKWLLQSGVRVDQATCLGYPVHFAAAALSGTLGKLGHWVDGPFEVGIDGKRQGEVINLLAHHGACLNLSGKGFPAPLHLACRSDYFSQNSNWPATTALLEAGVSVNADFWLVQDIDSGETITIADDNKRELLDMISTRGYHVVDKEWFLETAIQLKASRAMKDWQNSDPLEPVQLHLKQQSKLLGYAIENRQAEKVAMILAKYGPLPDLKIQGIYALMYAALHDQLETMRILLQHGANVHEKDVTSKTLLHYAAEGASSAVVQALLESGLDVEGVDACGWTPLMVAARHGNLSVVTTLFSIAQDRHLQLDRCTTEGQTLSHVAARGGSYDIFRLLHTILDPTALHQLDRAQRSCLDMAVEAQSVPLTQFLITQGLRASNEGQNGSTTLTRAIESMNGRSGSEILLLLLESGEACCTSVTKDNVTPLHLLAASNACWEDKADLIEHLLQKGALLNAKNAFGQTPCDVLCSSVREKFASSFLTSLSTLLRYTAEIEADCFWSERSVSRIADMWIEVARYPGENEEVVGFALESALLLLIKRTVFTTSMVKIWRPALVNRAYSLSEAIMQIIESLPSESLDSSHFQLLSECCEFGCTLPIFDRLLACFGQKVHKYDRKEDPLVHLTSEKGHVELLRRLLEEGFDIEARLQGLTPLMVATQYGQLGAVELLLHKQAQCYAQNPEGATAYHIACLYGFVDVLDRLDSHVFPEKFVDCQFSDSRDQCVAFIQLAAENGHTCVINYLLRNGVTKDINYATKKGVTALHFAAAHGHTDTVSFLLDAGADAGLRTSVGDLALHLAAACGKVGVVTTILKRRPDLLNTRSLKNGFTALHLASKSGHKLLVDLLLQKGVDLSLTTSQGLSAEIIAAMGGHKSIVTILATAVHIKGNSTHPSLPSPELMLEGQKTGAAPRISTDLSIVDPSYLSRALGDAVENGDIDLCSRLLNAGADPNKCVAKCRACSPLTRAFDLRFFDIAKLLVECGSSLRSATCSPCGLNAFHYVASLGWVDLLHNMLQMEHVPLDDTHITPMHLAAANGEVMCLKTLLDHIFSTRASQNIQLDLDRKYRLPSTVSHISVLRAGPKYKIDPSGGTALHLAILYSSLPCVQLLLRYGADLEAIDNASRTPFLLASAIGFLPILRVLVAAGANVHAKCCNGWNGVHYAAHCCGEPKVLQELQVIGVNFKQQNFSGKSPLFLATRQSKYEAVSWLLCHGHRFSERFNDGYSSLQEALKSGNTRVRSLAVDFSTDMTWEWRRSSSLLLDAYLGQLVGPAKASIRRARQKEQIGLLNQGSEVVFPPLLHAVSRDKTDFVELFLTEGANINQTWHDEGPPLKLACELGHLEIVRILVERGADTVWANNMGLDVDVFHAARYHKKIVEWLNDNIQGPHLQHFAAPQQPRFPTSTSCASKLPSSLPIAKVHRYFRKRASFELEYAIRGQGNLEPKSRHTPTNKARTSSTYHTHFHTGSKTTSSEPRGMEVTDLMSKANVLKRNLLRGEFRKTEAGTLDRAHSRWKDSICTPAYRGHRLTPFLLRSGDSTSWTIW